MVHAPQVHLSVGGAGEVLVMWATGKAQARAPALCHLAAACNYAKAPTWALQRMRMGCGQGPLPVSAWRLSVCVLAQHSLRARHSLQHPTTVHDEGVERVSMRLQGAALHQVLCA